jgi:S1-C subfamily serine protease
VCYTTRAIRRGEIVDDKSVQNLRAQHIFQKRDAFFRGAIANDFSSRIKHAGRGIIINVHGQIVTNAYVIEPCQDIFIRRKEDRYSAGLIFSYVANDVAVPGLSVAMAGDIEGYAKFSETFGRDKEQVFVVGYLLEIMLRLKPKFIHGIIDYNIFSPQSARVGLLADIRKGYSGGAVISDSGEILGMIYAKIDTVEAYKKMDVALPNIGVAIDSVRVRDSLRRHSVEYFL